MASHKAEERTSASSARLPQAFWPASLLAAGLMALALYLFYGWRAAGNFGFPLDDSWIHLQIARNVATGHGWSYNPGEPTGASTSPLWALLLAPLFRLPGDVTVWVKALGGLLFLTNILLVADVARRAAGDRRIAWLAGLLTAWGPTVVWGALSGMEVHLYLLLALLGLRAAVITREERGPGYAATLWLALAGWARPELWALLPVAWGYLAWRPAAGRTKDESANADNAETAEDADRFRLDPRRPRRPRPVFGADVHPAAGATADENAAEHPACTWAAARPGYAVRAGGTGERSEAQSKGAERSSGQGRILRLRAIALRSGCSRIFTVASLCIPHLLIAAAIIGAFLAFNLWAWGRPLPGTWYAKTAFGAGDEPVGLLQRGLHFLSQLMSSLQAAVYSQNPLLAVTLALGGVALWGAGPTQRRGLALLLGAAVAACIAAAAADLGSVGLQHYRRAAHLVASLNVLSAAGAVALWDLLRGSPSLIGLLAPRAAGTGPGSGSSLTGRRMRVAAGWLLAGAVVAMQLAGLRQGALLYANDTRSINLGDVAAAQWIAANTPADAIIAVNDIGALAYFGGRRVVDLVGLASPEVVAVTSTSRPGSAEREARLRDLLLAQGVDYVVMFPEWFPHLAADPALVEAARFTVPRASALAYDTVVVYRLARP